MQIPQYPDDESLRLQAVQRYDLLDTTAEADFDDITQLASNICETPIALITLLDTDRQWFKSKVGIDATETARNISFCGHAILGNAILEIMDARQDQRFFDNPLVTGQPNIRFYAGAPLITSDGFRLGTLCVIDRVARVLSERQHAALEALSRQVVRQMEARTVVRELAQKSRFQTAVLNSADLAMISSTIDGAITGFNRAAEQLLGYSAADMIGLRSLDFCYDPVALAQCAAELSRQEGCVIDPGFALLTRLRQDAALGSGEWHYRHKNGSVIPVRIAITPILDESGASVGYLSTARDVTDQKKAETSHQQALEFIHKISQRVPGMIYQYRLRPDGSSCFPYASQGMHAMYRMAPERVLDDASPVFDLIHPDDLDGIVASIQVSAKTLEPWQHEYRIRFPDQTMRWLFANSLPEREQDGAILWHGFITDVTDQKAAALALQSSQQFLHTLIDNLPVGIYTKRLRKEDIASGGTLMVWNRAAERMSGIRAAAVIGCTNRAVFSRSVADVHEAHDRVLLETKAAVTMPVFPMRHADGTIKLLCMTSVPLLDERGEVEYTLGIAEDVTDRLQQKKELLQRQAELEAVNDASPLGLFHTDADGAWTYVNRTCETMTGLFNGCAFGQGWRRAIHPEDAERVAASWRGAAAGKLHYDSVHRFLHVDGKIVLVKVQAAPIVVYGTVTGYVGTLDDITARRAANVAIADNEQRLRLITDNLPVAITYIDSDRRYRFANAVMLAWTGMAPGSIEGKLVRDVVGATVYDEHCVYLDRALTGERVEFERTSIIFKQLRYLQSIYIPDCAANGQVKGIYTLSNDISALKRTEEELRRLVHVDSLTGLPNRAHLHGALDAALGRSKRRGTALAVLFLDIDHFKSINDSLGHAGGDLVLQEFASRLTKSVRTTDTVGRLAGDEFLIILEGLKAQQEADLVAGKILKLVGKSWLVNGEKLAITTSIGIAYDQTHGHSGSALIAHADACLYDAKAAGRNTFRARAC